MAKFNVLIAYASRYGSTKEVAHVVGEEFYQKGYKVDIINIIDVTDVKEYDVVIIGAAIQYDKWMKEAKHFIKRFTLELSKKQIAYFFTCLTLIKNRQKDINKAMQYSKAILSTSYRVKPLSVGAFAGVLDYTQMNYFSKFTAKIIFSLLRIEHGDYRKWKDIYQWINQTVDDVERNLLQYNK